jgi:hypothetical protein
MPRTYSRSDRLEWGKQVAKAFDNQGITADFRAETLVGMSDADFDSLLFSVVAAGRLAAHLLEIRYYE